MAQMLSRTLAEWASQLKYDQLTPDAIEYAKAFLYDSLGCAFGGARLHDSQIVEKHVAEKAAKPECTVFGSGMKTHSVEAAFLNNLMIRAMDYNDIYWKADPSHPSDIIAGPRASCASATGLSGRDLILGDSCWPTRSRCGCASSPFPGSVNAAGITRR